VVAHALVGDRAAGVEAGDLVRAAADRRLERGALEVEPLVVVLGRTGSSPMIRGSSRLTSPSKVKRTVRSAVLSALVTFAQ
jgi:hypothetical protein